VVPELRPRGIGEILDAAVVLYRTRFSQLVRYSAIVIVPLQVLLTIVNLSAQPDRFSVTFNGSATPQFDSGGAQLGALFVILVVGLISHAFVAAVTTRFVADEYVGLEEPAAQAARTAYRRYFAVLGVGLLAGMSQIAGLAFCFVGSFAVQAFFAVAVPIVILERRGVFAALGRSIELTRSHFWHVLGLVLAASLLTAFLNIALVAGLNIWSTRGGSPTSLAIAQGVVNTIAALITTPFVAAAIVTLYFDLRIRDEAFDVQMAIAR
jgi:hypothetical protein